MTDFQYLFEPLKIGPMEVSNRICFSAHSSHFVEDSLPTERQARYYEERAKGGAGWLVIGATTVHESSSQHPQMNLVSEKAIPGYRRITSLAHEHGAKISSQMDHYGNAVNYPRQGRTPLLAPSPLPNLYGLETPKEMEDEDFAELLDASAKAAAVLKESGFDGVELLASMGFSLIQNFLSPRTNVRDDQYGGSIENRMRFPLQLLETVRSVIGGEMALGLKLAGDELIDGGLTQADCQEIATRFVVSGLIDYMHVCVGALTDTSVWLPEMSYPPGFATYLAAGVREQVEIPILTVKRINDPVQAEKLLAEGQADLVAMARALIADPELPNKAREGRLQEIRQCTASNQECAHRSSHWFPISCIHNPSVGFEDKWGIGTVRATDAPRRVTVVGGGPGGLKAAELAAQRGHAVTLYERESELGGQVNWITSVASRRDFESVIRYLRHQVERLGVDLRLGTEASAEAVLGEEPDAVVVATGAEGLCSGFSPYLPNVKEMPGAGQDNVLTVFDVFRERGRLGEKVLVVDEYADAEGVMIAEYLAGRGHQVEMVGRNPQFAVHLIHEDDLGVTLGRLAEKSVTMTPLIGVTEVSGKHIGGAHMVTGEPWEREVDTVVLHMGKQADEGLYRALKGRAKDLYRVGDCVTPRRITDAIYEGNIVGREL